MGEPFSCQPPFEGCCLDFPETILVLVALIIVVQLGLKLAVVLCYYLWYLVGLMFGMVVVQEKPKTTISKAKKTYSVKARPSLCWSEVDIPYRRRRKESRSPSHRCLHCTLEPLKVTMNLQNENPPYRVGRRPYADYPPLPPSRYYAYESKSRPQARSRRASAPSAYAVTRYRDASVGSSDPNFRGNTPERRSVAAGTEPPPRRHIGEAQHRTTGPGPEAEPQLRSRRPAKVYIYPVSPQTPSGSRSSSPERRSRRHHRRRRVKTSSQEEQQKGREARWKAREAKQTTPSPMTLHYQAASTNIAQPEPPTGKPRYYWSDQVSGADWVYQPAK